MCTFTDARSHPARDTLSRNSVNVNLRSPEFVHFWRPGGATRFVAPGGKPHSGDHPAYVRKESRTPEGCDLDLSRPFHSRRFFTANTAWIWTYVYVDVITSCKRSHPSGVRDYCRTSPWVEVSSTQGYKASRPSGAPKCTNSRLRKCIHLRSCPTHAKTGLGSLKLIGEFRIICRFYGNA